MKRVFTLLAFVSLVVSGVSAQNLRKTWDFREGFSQKTVNALFHTYGDLVRVQMVKRLAVICAQHNDHTVDRSVRFQDKRQSFQPVSILPAGVLENGGSSTKPFFNNPDLP